MTLPVYGGLQDLSGPGGMYMTFRAGVEWATRPVRLGYRTYQGWVGHDKLFQSSSRCEQLVGSAEILTSILRLGQYTYYRSKHVRYYYTERQACEQRLNIL
jgi:hypothetical protein